MSLCEIIHKEGKLRFCSVCGKSLFNNLIEKFNQELLPELMKYTKGWYNTYAATAIKIYDFVIEHNLKKPDDVIFLEIKNDGNEQKFLSKDECYSKYPEHVLYGKKLSYDPWFKVCDIPWIRHIPAQSLIDEIKQFEAKYGAQLPDKNYDISFKNSIQKVDECIKQYINVKNDSEKEYLIAVIKKM